MKKFSLLLACILLLQGLLLPCSASALSEEQVISRSEVTLDNGIQMVETITVSTGASRATSDRTYTKERTYLNTNGDIIAAIRITGTFSYNGYSVAYVKKSSSYDTYLGWSFTQDSLTATNGGPKATITITGTLFYPSVTSSNIDVQFTLSCDAQGNIS